MAGYGKQGVVRNLFLWSVGVIYLFAFSSLYVQIPGLYGKNGVLPAKLALREVSSSVEENFRRKPTLLWFMPKLGLDTETGMEFLCLLGMLLSLLATSLESWRVSITFFVLWFLYFSLFQVGQTFMWFQWDILLLESGFLTILVSPLNLFKSRKARHHDNITLWLVKWLAFRLMFCSGVVKLSSRCPTWWGLTALDWHYESQCIPTPLAWYAHQLPKWFQRLSVVLTYVILMALSLLFFAPVRSLRIFSFYSQIFFQVLIILTGNYNFFNLLAIALLLAILDDQHIVSFLPSWLVKNSYISPAPCSTVRKVVSRIVALGTVMITAYWTVRLFALEVSSKNVLNSSITFSKDAFFKTVDKVVPFTIWMGIASLSAEIISSLIGCILEKGILNKVWCLLQWTVFSFAALGMFAISLVPYTDISQEAKSNLWPVLNRWRHKTDPFELVNSYGLFRSMTGVGGRPEVIIEGSHSMDGPWKEYNFLYKPGNLYQAPPLVAPHQPRIDWQMWFAALGSYDYNPWFVHLVYRLLQGQQDVLDLMARNPFPKRSPKYIRAHLYRYHYTTLPRNMTSVADVIQNNRLVKRWWWRKYDREYIPILSVEEPSLVSWLNRYGFAKDEAWPERPSGRLYKVIKYLRSIVRNLDAFRFLIGLFASGCLMGILNCFLLRERPPKSV